MQQWMKALNPALYAQLSGATFTGPVTATAFTGGGSGLTGLTGANVTGAVPKANTIASNGGYATFNWSGQAGQPNWLWGSNDGINFAVWNPANFNVSHASAVDSATNATNAANPSNAATFLEALMLSSAVTIQADPGGTPANGTPGTMVLYY